MPTDRAEVVRMLREAVIATGSRSIVLGLSGLADDIERREVDSKRALSRLDYAIARTRSPRVLAAATAAMEWLGEQRRPNA